MHYLIYDREGKPQALLQNVTSIQWHPEYWESGSAEIHARPTADNIRYLIPFNRVICQERGEILFINYAQRSTDDEIIIHGKLDNLDQRINTTTASITRVEAGLLKLVESNRRGLDIAMAPEKGLSAKVERTETTYRTLRESFETFCQATKLGWREVVKDGQLNTLEIYEGQVKSGVRFRDDLGNILYQKYTRNLENARNYAYVLGEDRGTDRAKVEVDLRATGDPRLEMYVDARDLQSEYKDENGDDQTYTTEQYEALLRARGEAKLAVVNAEAFTFECTLNSDDTLAVLGKDYDLGDVVPVVSQLFRIVVFARIVGIKFVEENNQVTTSLELYIESQEDL